MPPSSSNLAITDWREFAPLDVDVVLRAAIDVFVEKGYHGATVRQIAQRAGLSVPGIYHHYATKQDMLVRILDMGMDEVLCRTEMAMAEGGDNLMTQFELLVECLALSMIYRRDITLVGTSEMRSLEKTNRPRIAAARVALQRRVDDAITAGREAGLMSTPHPADAARAVVSITTSIPQWYRPTGKLKAEQLAAHLVHICRALVECDK
jgi:AcrR family transcriptional regulator